ncbi:exonuclease domain-containing protein [Bdellovibrio sp. HCB337]|uniref:exonuclease domain-containing protein n=1 Tax=Bdellovibrio sp. HCB337 TaxID=3394358 RepID=UPI0039A74118
MTNRNGYMELHRPWTEYTYVAFDTETSGAYPIGSDVIEFGAVKWRGGQEVGSYQTLLKPRGLLTEFNMSIHGITNEMVADAPKMSEKVREIYDFMSDAIPMAHHAPFDMGFMAVEFETHMLPLLNTPVVCTSLLSRKWIHGCENHKLQTLVKFLNLQGGAAHRALDDARSCLQVGLDCFKRMGEQATLAEALKSQGKNLQWNDYSLLRWNNPVVKVMIEAIYQKKNLEIVYEKSAAKAEPRQLTPEGIVRNPDGDYLQAFCLKDKINKRFLLAKIKDAAVLY